MLEGTGNSQHLTVVKPVEVRDFLKGFPKIIICLRNNSWAERIEANGGRFVGRKKG